VHPGSLPDAWFLPVQWTLFTPASTIGFNALTTLRLDGNMLSGAIPAALANLATNQPGMVLWLAHNLFTGTVPSALSAFTTNGVGIAYNPLLARRLASPPCPQPTHNLVSSPLCPTAPTFRAPTHASTHTHHPDLPARRWVPSLRV
jgi:hypothetical protein